jgi:hypothetical protein
MRRLALLLGLLVLSAGACAEVRPWQRETLASPTMQFSFDPGADQESSILEITEGGTFSAGGPGSAGAGCGCH